MIDYTCCIHNMDCISVRNDFSKNNNCIDHKLHYIYLNGTKSIKDKSNLNFDIIDTYTNNIYTKFNKQLRYLSSLMYLLKNNVLNNSYFLFMNCTSCLKDNNFLDKLNYDYLYMSNPLSIYNGKIYRQYIRIAIDKLYSLYGKDNVISFYYNNFMSFNIESNENGTLPPFNICLNKNNSFIIEIFNDLINPFLLNDNIKYFNGDLTRLLMYHLYYKKYSDKFSICSCIDIQTMPRNVYEYMHYYGD